MTSSVKPATPSHAELVRAANLYRVAIVGAASLKGKELVEVLNERNFPSAEVKVLDDDESLGQLESVGDEVTFIQKIRSEEFRNVDFTFFAGDSASTRKSWKLARDAGNTIIDLSFGLEEEKESVVRSPWVERQLGVTRVPELQPGPVVVAHPAATVLALLLLRLWKAKKMQRAAAIVFEPASEHGQKGMDELHEQTVNLLSFQELPKRIFDTQVAFNMVSRYGEKSVSSLATVESRVLKHYREIAGQDAAVPSLLVLQAPIFHGHAFAVHVESDQTADIEQLTQALNGEHVNVTREADNTPTNVSAAGQNDVQVSAVKDASQATSFWLWAATDNLRIVASNAVECAETLTTTRPRGKIQ
jgi:aspartate-semialdehyde dehydrogenase